MSTERAISQPGNPGNAYTADLSVPSADASPAATDPEATGYPEAPSAAACGALVPCRHTAQGCPVGVDVPAVARAIAGGDHERAFRWVRAAHPFPSTCGNGCYAPCESACRRRPFGAPVAIGALEEYAASLSPPALVAPDGPCGSRFEARSVAGGVSRSVQQALATARSGKTVAILGAGPAGLACAHDLILLGHRVILFDARPDPGGLMTSGIPSFRFPVSSARAECIALLALGIEFRGASPVTDLATLRGIGVDAIFLAIGASRAAARTLESAPQHPDIHDAMEVLSSDVVPVGQTIVAGEGPLAIDVARALAKRSLVAGTASVQLVLTTPLEPNGLSPELLASCARDGIRIEEGWRIRAVNVDANSGLLASIDLAGGNGMAARVMPCDRLILAPGRAPDLRGIASDLELTRSGFIATDPQTLRTSLPNVWAGGACAFGHRSIAHAVADGKRAAWDIHAAITGMRVTTTFASAWVEANAHVKPDRPEANRRRTLPLIDPPSIDPFAAPTPRAATRAGEEAARCFDCARIPALTGECTSCHRCAESCPTGAITIVERAPVIAGELCNRCGDCIGACPDGALTMLRAEWEERISFA